MCRFGLECLVENQLGSEAGDRCRDPRMAVGEPPKCEGAAFHAQARLQQTCEHCGLLLELCRSDEKRALGSGAIGALGSERGKIN